MGIEQTSNSGVSATKISAYIAHQDVANQLDVSTTTANTYVGNKLELVMTEVFKFGKLSYDNALKRVVHTGSPAGYAFNATSSVSSNSIPNAKIWYSIFKNGVQIEATESFGKFAGADGTISLNGASYVYMEDGDYLEVFVKTDKLNLSFLVDSTHLQFIQIS